MTSCHSAPYSLYKNVSRGAAVEIFKLTKWKERQTTLTCRWWERVRRCRWRNRSQSVHRLPHMLQRMMAAVSPSSWLSHMGCGEKRMKSLFKIVILLISGYLVFLKQCMFGGFFYTALTICFCCPSLPIQRPEDSLSTWSWSSTHREAKANHNYETEWDIFVNTDMRWRCIYVFLLRVKRAQFLNGVL